MTTEGRDPSNPNRYLGADDAVGSVVIPLADVPQPNTPGEPIIGIEIMRIDPDEDDKEGCSGYLGYAPMWKATWEGAKPDEYDIDDIHTSLADLCDDYGLDLDLVLDRMAIALLRK